MWTHKHPTHRKTQRHNDVDEIEGLYYRLPLQMGNKNFASRPSDHRPTAEIKPSIDGRRQDFVKRGIRLWRQLETAGTANVSKRRRFVNVKTFNHVRCARYLRHLLFLERQRRHVSCLSNRSETLYPNLRPQRIRERAS